MRRVRAVSARREVGVGAELIVPTYKGPLVRERGHCVKSNMHRGTREALAKASEFADADLYRTQLDLRLPLDGAALGLIKSGKYTQAAAYLEEIKVSLDDAINKLNKKAGLQNKRLSEVKAPVSKTIHDPVEEYRVKLREEEIRNIQNQKKISTLQAKLEGAEAKLRGVQATLERTTNEASKTSELLESKDRRMEMLSKKLKSMDIARHADEQRLNKTKRDSEYKEKQLIRLKELLGAADAFNTKQTIQYENRIQALEKKLKLGAAS